MNVTGIEWTATVEADGTVSPGFTSNPIKYRDKATGKTVWACVKHSAGCAACYAESLAHRYGRGGPFIRSEMEKVEPFACEKELRAMLASKKIVGKKVFVGDMTDCFGEWVTDAMLDKLFAVFALRRDVTWQVLTKRADRMAAYLASRSRSAQPWKDAARSLGWSLEFEGYSLVPYPLPNVWCGFSAENQENFDRRAVDMAAVMRAGWLVFVSAEPLLGPILMSDRGEKIVRNWLGEKGISWVIAGGESGPDSRPCRVEWIRSIVRQCQAAQVPVFVKQMGGNVVTRNDMVEDGFNDADGWPDPDVEHDIHGFREEYQGADCRIRLRDRKGGDLSELPPSLRVREFPHPVEARP